MSLIPYLNQEFYTSDPLYSNNPGAAPIHIHVLKDYLILTIDCGKMDCLKESPGKIHFRLNDNGDIIGWKVGWGSSGTFTSIFGNYTEEMLFNDVQKYINLDSLKIKEYAQKEYQNLQKIVSGVKNIVDFKNLLMKQNNKDYAKKILTQYWEKKGMKINLNILKMIDGIENQKLHQISLIRKQFLGAKKFLKEDNKENRFQSNIR